MASLDRNLRKDLENAVKRARRVAEAGAEAALVALRVGDRKVSTGPEAPLRRRLRAHGRQLGDKLDERKETQSIERLKDECAYQHWHRLLFARFLAENDLLVEPESGMALSLDECRELAREQSRDWLGLASDFAQRMLPQIFRAGDPVLEVALPPEKRQELEAILEWLPREVFIADDSLGWVYQFWQTDLKDAVNASENKIGADELPAVTQLFTEDYMVLFLLHNTLGAWWAGKVLAANPVLARSAASEDELRAACALRGIEWSYLRFVREGDVWRPAAGTFPCWPTAAKDLTVLDPCMGSGHFLAFALPMLVALRREGETLSIADGVDAVLRDNLFGLELDPRCTQIAAFNVGLSAWKLAGYRPLPALNLACSGLAISARESDWLGLAGDDARAKSTMSELYSLFRDAPTLGSLIDPAKIGGGLFTAGIEATRPLLDKALQAETNDDATTELAVTAKGVATAARLLGRKYSLVATNVPYLSRSRQGKTLREYCDRFHDNAKHDLAMAFLERCQAFGGGTGALAVVIPTNWLSLSRYESLRKQALRDTEISFLARLDAGAFDAIGGEVVNVALYGATGRSPSTSHAFCGIDASTGDVASKSAALRSGATLELLQNDQFKNPDARILLDRQSGSELLSLYAESRYGLRTGDLERLSLCFWELPNVPSKWRPFQGTVESSRLFGGRERVLLWEDDRGALRELADQGIASIQGADAWRHDGVAVSLMGGLPATLYSGDIFDNGTAVVWPRQDSDRAAIYAYCSSPEFLTEVRKIDRSIKITNQTLLKVPFDAVRWRSEAQRLFPNGLPSPSSNDCRQWLFAGDARHATDVLHVVLGRLLGYRWPRQQGLSTRDCSAVPGDALKGHEDDDGIVCLPALKGEPAAGDRVISLLATSLAGTWSAAKLDELLEVVGWRGRPLDAWLREQFFAQHCELFSQRPFIWHVWDGLKDGFAAFVNYHKLAAPNGEGRRTLEKLIYTYLGDWLDRQRADQKAGVEGADGRVAAAEHLKRELQKILEGEPPYDLFVRWKPLHQQPVGWEPDIDDGVRVNIRPFMTAKPLNTRGKNACILRVAPKIKWEKDRGKEPTREKADYPWFWGWDEETENFMGGSAFDGNRWNDLHYSRAVKLAARESARAGKP